MIDTKRILRAEATWWANVKRTASLFMVLGMLEILRGSCSYLGLYQAVAPDYI